MNDRDSFYKRVGQLVRKARQDRNFAQEFLASAVGLTRTSISNIEKGRQKMLLHTFCEIADILGVEPDKLLPEPLELDLTLKQEDLQKIPEPERAFIEAGLGIKKRREDANTAKKNPDGGRRTFDIAKSD